MDARVKKLIEEYLADDMNIREFCWLMGGLAVVSETAKTANLEVDVERVRIQTEWVDEDDVREGLRFILEGD